MILPSKHVTENESLIGIGAVLLNEANQPHTVTSLWESVRGIKTVGTFERYVLALDMLYIIGALTLSNGMIVRNPL